VAQQVEGERRRAAGDAAAEGGRRRLRRGQRGEGGGRPLLWCAVVAALSSSRGLRRLAGCWRPCRHYGRGREGSRSFRVDKETGGDQTDPQSNGRHREFAGSDGQALTGDMALSGTRAWTLDSNGYTCCPME